MSTIIPAPASQQKGEGPAFRLRHDTQLVAEGTSGPPRPGGGFQLGSTSSDGGFLGPVAMDLDAVTFWDRAR